MQVVIMAGGKGTRLRPYTVTLPKPLVPVGDKPILEIILGRLKAAGATEVVVSTGHMAEFISSYFGDGSKWGLRIRYVREEAPLNTAGPLALIDGLEDDFIVMNGDVLTDMDIRAFWNAHLEARAAATIAICERSVAIDFGVVEIDDAGRLARYNEKPSLTYFVSMGINALNRRALKHVEKGRPLGMPDLLLKLKAAGETVACHRSRDRWLDIGRPDDYAAAQELPPSPADK